MATTRFSETFLLAKVQNSMAFMVRVEKEECGRERLPYVHSSPRAYVSPSKSISRNVSIYGAFMCVYWMKMKSELLWESNLFLYNGRKQKGVL